MTIPFARPRSKDSLRVIRKLAVDVKLRFRNLTAMCRFSLAKSSPTPFRRKKKENRKEIQLKFGKRGTRRERISTTSFRKCRTLGRLLRIIALNHFHSGLRRQ